MELLVKRNPSDDECTLGVLEVNGIMECYTLEDVVREVPGKPVEEWKIYGKTAIPTGTYVVDLTYSAHFGRVLPQVQGVQGFEGVRIHPGNTAADTEGCLLVGMGETKDAITKSRDAFTTLYSKIEAAIKGIIPKEKGLNKVFPLQPNRACH